LQKNEKKANGASSSNSFHKSMAIKPNGHSQVLAKVIVYSPKIS